MNRQAESAIGRLRELRAADWAALDQLARRAGTGDWRWDEAWSAAAAGHAAATIALRTAIALGAPSGAGAAVAGAVAALEAGDALEPVQRELLLGPAAALLGASRRAPESVMLTR